jgi:hypothetical protein
MCLLTFLPTGVTPDTDALLCGSLINNDGHGFAIVTDGRIIVERGMDADALIEAFARLRRRHPHGPALFHSRLGTHGTTRLDNCHPFPVGGDTRTVIAHNGILPKAVQPADNDPRSDTRIAAEEFLPAFGPLRLRRTRLRLERWMTRYNKMVILTVDRRFKHQAYILNESAGIWDAEIWYSNDGYRPTKWGRRLWSTTAYGPQNDIDGLDRCWSCGVLADDDGYCPYCGCCIDCTDPRTGCLCYRPAVPHHAGGLHAPPAQPDSTHPRTLNVPAGRDVLGGDERGGPAYVRTSWTVLPRRPDGHA